MDLHNKKILQLIEKTRNRAKERGFDTSGKIVEDEVDMALLEYYNDRHFNPTDSNPYEDIYEGIIIQLALCSMAKYGAEGERIHSEGGVVRTYDNASNYPAKLTQKIIPLVKGVDI